MEWALDHLALVYRPVPSDLPAGQPGDVVEVHCVGGPVREVDPVTRKSRATIQCFLCGNDGSINPVKRDSWNTRMPIPQRAKARVLTALEAYQEKHQLFSSKARML